MAAKPIRTINDARSAILAKWPKGCSTIRCFAWFRDWRFTDHKTGSQSFSCQLRYESGKEIEVDADTPSELVKKTLRAIQQAKEVRGVSVITPKTVQPTVVVNPEAPAIGYQPRVISDQRKLLCLPGPSNGGV